MSTTKKSLSFTASKSAGAVSAVTVRPRGARAWLIFGHGAGAGMEHPFMSRVSELLAERGVATFRYQFPYMEKGRKAPDPQPVLLATIRSAVEAAGRASRGLPLFAGGKSMGGRMTSLAAASEPLPGVRGLVFFGFPLHGMGKPSAERAAHLSDVTVPMLFLQGTRDNLADLGHVRRVTRKLGAKAELHVVDGGDHSFHVRKSDGRTDAEVLKEVAGAAADWILARA